MKKLFIALVAIASFASCKKETVNTPTVPQEPVFAKNLKTSSYVYDGGAPEIENFSFDAQGRITSYKQEYPGTVRQQTFDYATAGKIFSTYTNNGVLKFSHEGTVNEKGYITAMTTKRADGSLYLNYKYIYDVNGYIIKKEWTNAAGITDHFEMKVENGNVTEYKLFYNGILSSTDKFTYDLTKYNSIKSAFGSQWSGTSFGKSTKNLFTNLTETNASGAITWNVNYSYQLNAAGYVEKSSFTNLITSKSGENTYTFQ